MLSQIQPLSDIQRYGDTERPASPVQGEISLGAAN
jgi:hypothetical protein